MDHVTNRILEQLGDPALLEKLSALSGADRNSLLLKLFEMQAEKITPPELLKQYAANRFSVPSDIDPVQFHLMSAALLQLAQAMGMKAVMLSPAAPFASCSTFDCVSQNNVVSALRGTEILSDPTNMLAILLADQMKRGEVDGRAPLHYCTAVRVLRGQAFPDIPGFYAHFGLFCIVSAAKDTGSYTSEKQLLKKHLACYKKLFQEQYDASLSVVLRKRSGYADGDGFFASMTALVQEELPDIPLSFDVDHADNNYYKGVNFKLFVQKGDQQIEVGDGGFVDWLQRMTGNKKQRCLISGIGLDRLLL